MEITVFLQIPVLLFAILGLSGTYPEKNSKEDLYVAFKNSPKKIIVCFSLQSFFPYYNENKMFVQRRSPDKTLRPENLRLSQTSKNLQIFIFPFEFKRTKT